MPHRFAARVEAIRPFLAMEVLERAFALAGEILERARVGTTPGIDFGAEW